MSDSIATSVLRHLQEACTAANSAIALDPDTPLASLDIHSLRLIELVYELEVRFAVQVDEERLARLQTVGDVQQMFVAAIQSPARHDDVRDEDSRGAGGEAP
jgi:acyl carrier protein